LILPSGVKILVGFTEVLLPVHPDINIIAVKIILNAIYDINSHLVPIFKFIIFLRIIKNSDIIIIVGII
jgi:hypothetical protein